MKSLEAAMWSACGRLGARTLKQNPQAHARGTVPKLQSAAGHKAADQGLYERQLRRIVRRLCEAHNHALQAKPVPTNLISALRKSSQRWPINHEVRNHQWLPAIQKLEALLQQHLKTTQDHRAGVETKGSKSTQPLLDGLRKQLPPWLLKTKQGNIVSGRNNGARALRDDWQQVFFPPNYTPDTQAYLNSCGHFFPQLPVQDCLPLNPVHLQEAVHEMKHKAPGPDGWVPQALKMLPQMAWVRLCQILDAVEETGTRPQGLRSWRVCFIPKTSSSGMCDTLKTRPIAVGAIIYRAWARVRSKEATAHLPRSVLGPLQVGGLKAHDAENVLLALDQESSPQSHPLAMSLDFQKAFDSTDWETAWNLMARCGIAPKTCRTQHV